MNTKWPAEWGRCSCTSGGALEKQLFMLCRRHKIRSKMMDNNFFDYSLAMERIKSVTGCKTQQELAKFLGVSQSCISDAKKRMAIPAEWLLKLLKKENINPDWVRSGLGSQYLYPSEAGGDILQVKPEALSSGCLMQEFFFSLVRRAIDGNKLT